MTLRGSVTLRGELLRRGGGDPHATPRCGSFPPLACLFDHYLYDDRKY